MGISYYSAFNGNPILYPDPLGDSTGPISVKIKIPTQWAINYYGEKLDAVHARNLKSFNLFDKEERYFLQQWEKYVHIRQDEELAAYAENIERIKHPLAPAPAPVARNTTAGSFTRSDAVSGLRLIYTQYGKDMAMTVERVYRLESADFTSGQFRNTGTAGMEVHGAAPYYGWTKGYFTDLPTGTWSAFENKGLSAVGGNAQVTTRKKEFVVMPSVASGMIFLANFIQGHGGNAARWFSTSTSALETYKSTINSKASTIVNGFSNDK